MNQPYYEQSDLEDFPNIGEYASEAGKKFFEYYNAATGPGKLTEREKSLIALAVATVRHCPYCIDSFTNKCLSLGSCRRGHGCRRHIGTRHTDAQDYQEKGNVRHDRIQSIRG